MSTALATLTTNMAKRFELGESNAQELMTTLKATAFKGQVSDAQMTALMLVAQQYSLNPWTREIYAFPDRQNGIVPVVGVDGWSRIINENVQFDGIDFEQDDDSCTCIIYRKDRSHPIKVTEWLSECKRDNAGPWKSHPKRMLRHKALIQCARLAFGFLGIYDQDEAERIVEIDVQSGEKVIKQEPTYEKPALEYCPDERFLSNQESWRKAILSGKKSVSELIAMLETKYLLTEEQKMTIDSWSHEGD